MIDPVTNIAAIAPVIPKPMAMDMISVDTSKISFMQLLQTGFEVTNAKIGEANRMVAAFAVDNDIPAHQVTFALEEARQSLEMMIQVRNRVIEGYQQIMNMQV